MFSANLVPMYVVLPAASKKPELFDVVLLIPVISGEHATTYNGAAICEVHSLSWNSTIIEADLQVEVAVRNKQRFASL